MHTRYSEFDLISLISKKFSKSANGLLTGIGDDCAVIRKDRDSVYLVTTDALVEGVHFTCNNFSYEDIGHKALAVNLSDIAAMGGIPKFYFVSLGLPRDFSKTSVKKIYQGMTCLTKSFNATLAGGNVSRSVKGLWLSITVIGEAKKNQCKLRSGARVGDGIYVSGKIGNAALGLYVGAALRGRPFSKNARPSHLRLSSSLDFPFLRSQRRPEPRIKLGQLLAKEKSVHAMIDVSDGLIQDLGHICDASTVNAIIHYDAIPRVKNFTKICDEMGTDEREILLAGGEDYELLFTMAECDAERVSKLASKIGEKITRLGCVEKRVSKKKAITVCDVSGNEILIKKMGFDHGMIS